MSGFDKDWLRLREPADGDSRAGQLVETLGRYLDLRPQPIAIMDIGCGTGSTYRTLSPLLPTAQWKLLDYETSLLEEAERQIGHRDDVGFHCADLNTLDETLMDDVDVITASALFDLCSADFCNRFVEGLGRRGIALYAALNYNGVMEWSIKHPLDSQVVDIFNLHQKSDKGFGQALGPDASAHLATVCRSSGFTVALAESPWRLRSSQAALQEQFLAGFEKPIRETGGIQKSDFDAWLDFRQSNIRVDSSLCIVGHTDFLALPET